MSKSLNEPLLTENPNRYVMFPLQDQEIWQHYKKMEDCFWRTEEIDLSKDLVHWNNLKHDEKHFIKRGNIALKSICQHKRTKPVCTLHQCKSLQPIA